MFKNKRITAVLFGRHNSKRLKNKLLRKINNLTLLEISFIIIKKIKLIDDVILATTTKKEDVKLINIAKKYKIKYYRGSENNVLERCYKAIEYHSNKNDIIVRFCCENPLTSENLINKNIKSIVLKDYDLMSMIPPSNVVLGSCPIFIKQEALNSIYKNAKDKIYKEHIENFCYDYKNKYKIKYILDNKKFYFPETSLSIDDNNDLLRVKNIFRENKLKVNNYSYDLFSKNSEKNIYLNNEYLKIKIKQNFKNKIKIVKNINNADLIISENDNFISKNKDKIYVYINKVNNYIYINSIKDNQNYTLYKISQEEGLNKDTFFFLILNSIIEKVRFWPPTEMVNLSKKIKNSKSKILNSKKSMYNYFPEIIYSNKKIETYKFSKLKILSKYEIEKKLQNRNFKAKNNAVFVIDNFYSTIKKNEIKKLERYNKENISKIFTSYEYTLI